MKTYPDDSASPIEEGRELPGLTKREYMATQIAAALCSQGEHGRDHAMAAVSMADALIAELNAEEKKTEPEELNWTEAFMDSSVPSAQMIRIEVETVPNGKIAHVFIDEVKQPICPFSRPKPGDPPETVARLGKVKLNQYYHDRLSEMLYGDRRALVP